MPHNIYLDGSILSRQVASGISNYVINIFKHFKQNERQTGINGRLILLNKLPTSNRHFVEAGLPPTDLMVLNSREFFGKMIFGNGFTNSIFHSPYMFLPPKRKRRINLLTVHDLINLERKFSFRHKFRENLLRLAIRRADYFICISNATRERLQQHFPHVALERIFVVYQGIGPEFSRPTNSVILPKSKPYFLYVGLRSEYKNFECLIDFFRHTRWKNDFDIICVGGGAFTKTENSKLDENGLRTTIRHAGYVSNAELISLYASATALLYTSLQEGFGIPIIEAMATGCPVICGNFSSMKEVAGTHAILVNDFSPDSLHEAVNKAISHGAPEKEKARLYAQSFTWEKTALETLTVYQKLSGLL
jgi:glycosyltransferase involved in cell wall biosynthesis